ncbi:MAG: hypothetical protein J5988_06345 [Eubacterium sp.]|nr:hypothetical protein [Eubacterium sp.]
MYIGNFINNNNEFTDREVYLYAMVKHITELPNGCTIAVGLDTWDASGKRYRELFFLCTDSLDNGLMPHLVEVTPWYQNGEYKSFITTDKLRELLIGEIVGIKVRFVKQSPEITDIFCVDVLNNYDFHIDNFKLIPKTDS